MIHVCKKSENPTQGNIGVITKKYVYPEPEYIIFYDNSPLNIGWTYEKTEDVARGSCGTIYRPLFRTKEDALDYLKSKLKKEEEPYICPLCGAESPFEVPHIHVIE